MPKKAKETETTAKPRKSIESVLTAIRKEYGDSAIMCFDDDDNLPAVERISCGIPVLDDIMGGGLPKGRIIEIYGPESSGKTSVCLVAVATVQKNGGTCAYIDMEHAIDPIYAKKLGVDMKTLLFSQPDNGEMAIDIAESLMSTGSVSLIIVDSAAALTPQAEINGDIGDAHVGLIARLMGQAMRRLSLVAANTGATIIFINQLREKVNGGYGNPETTPGGRALKFFASIRLDIRKKDKLSEGGFVVGQNTVVKTVKNKTAPPFRSCSFDIYFDRGPDIMGSLVSLGIERGLIVQAGAWFTYNDQRFQGRNAVSEYFAGNPEEMANLRKALNL